MNRMMNERSGLYPTPFMGNYFCLMEKYGAAFVAVSKNAVTTLKNIVIHSCGDFVPDCDTDTHNYIGYTPYNGFLVPVKEMKAYEEMHGKYLKFAVWRDPVERFVSTYKWFILERHPREYFRWLDLYRDNSFDRFMEFARFELKKSDSSFQDEHIRRQSDYYSPSDVDYIVPIRQLNAFLEANQIPCLREQCNKTFSDPPLITESQRLELQNMYQADYRLIQEKDRKTLGIKQIFRMICF